VPHVVQVDDEERDHDPVAERVRHPAGLEQPDRARKLRLQTLEIRGEGFQRRRAYCSTRALPSVRLGRALDSHRLTVRSREGTHEDPGEHDRARISDADEIEAVCGADHEHQNEAAVTRQPIPPGAAASCSTAGAVIYG
jgi:hypothetical protein